MLWTINMKFVEKIKCMLLNIGISVIENCDEET